MNSLLEANRRTKNKKTKEIVQLMKRFNQYGSESIY